MLVSEKLIFPKIRVSRLIAGRSIDLMLASHFTTERRYPCIGWKFVIKTRIATINIPDCGVPRRRYGILKRFGIARPLEHSDLLAWWKQFVDVGDGTRDFPIQTKRLIRVATCRLM